MKKRRNTFPDDDAKLNMTPMIDVVFLLLIFFLVGTKFRTPEGELEAYLPEEGAPRQLHQRTVDVEEIRITLRVSRAGKNNPDAPPSIVLGESGSGQGTQGSINWLENELRRLSADQRVRDDVPVIIEAEPHLAYRWVVHTLNICRKARFKKVNFAASKRNAPKPTVAPKAPG